MARTPFAFLPMGTLPGNVLTISLTLFYGSLAALKMIIEIVRKRGAFFTVKDRIGPNRPKVLDRYGSHQFIRLKKQGIKLHYVSSGNNEKQLMLFVHGFPECWFSWRYQLEAFKNQYHTVAMNMRGYGESDKPKGVANYGFDILIADIIELIESLVSKKNPKCILVAHDWGGVLAWSVAQTRPDLVDRFIVLNAPHYSPWIKRIATTWKQFFASWYMFFFNFPYLPELNLRSGDFKLFDVLFGKFSKSPEEIDVYKHYFSQPYGITAPINYYRARLRGYGQFPVTVRPVQPPTLILWGRDDTALIAELAEDSAKLCADATVQYLDACTHWIMIDKPKEVNAAIAQFLSTANSS